MRRPLGSMLNKTLRFIVHKQSLVETGLKLICVNTIFSVALNRNGWASRTA